MGLELKQAAPLWNHRYILLYNRDPAMQHDIALLGYLAILHGRLVGWLRHFGMAAGSILSFSLVIMAWYGVNFVLGAGLHSYGFGAGGVEYVSAFVAIHCLFVAYVAVTRYSRLKSV